MKRSIVLFALFALLAGCSSMQKMVQGDKIQYKSEGKRELPPLEVPPDLTTPVHDSQYTVPNINPRGTATLSTYNVERGGVVHAGPTEVLPNVAKVRLERAGSERWLVVSEPPDKVWPIVKEFWQSFGFLIKTANPETGVMETDWAENRAKIPYSPIRSLLGKVFDFAYGTGTRDRFRTRLERGAVPGTTEVYISHQGLIEVYTSKDESSTAWEPAPPDPGLEAIFLRRLMVRFGVEQARARTELAQGGEDVEHAKLVHAANSSGSLQLGDPFDRAWRRVGLALDRVDFTVVDRDRSKGIYYVRYADPQAEGQNGSKDKGFFSKLEFWKSDKTPKKAEQYHILVKQVGSVSEVRVLDKDGAQDNSDTGRRILSLLYGQLK